MADPQSPLYMRPLNYAEMPMDEATKKDTLRIILENKSTPQELCELNFRLGEMFAAGIEQFIREQNIDLENDLDVISCHGQTVWFQPQPKPGEVKSTLQMCESTVLSQRFGKTVVMDFRPAEQMAGRQGAPIACFQDALALIHPTLNRASQNIGGIANVAFVPSEKDGKDRMTLWLTASLTSRTQVVSISRTISIPVLEMFSLMPQSDTSVMARESTIRTEKWVLEARSTSLWWMNF
jgi:1,6-anhydro-N-acetylmuramate kinase